MNKPIKGQIVNNALKLIIFAPSSFYIYLYLKQIYPVPLILSPLSLPLHSMTRVFPKAAQLILLILFTACFPIQIILQSKSPSEFAANFVYWRHPFIFKVKAAGLDKELNGRISSADDPVDYIWGYAGKQMVVFVISFAIFIVSCAFIVKPITVRDYWRVRF